MDIKETFNWLTEKPQRHYTLGEAWQLYVRKKPEDQIKPSGKLHFTRIGRITERVILLSTVAQMALTSGALMVAAVPALVASAGVLLPPYIAMGVALGIASGFNIAAAKVAGVVSGKIVDFVAKGINHVAQSPKVQKPAV